MEFRVLTVNGIYVTTLAASDLEHALILAEEDGHDVVDAYDDPTFQIIVADEVYKATEW